MPMNNPVQNQQPPPMYGGPMNAPPRAPRFQQQQQLQQQQQHQPQEMVARTIPFPLKDDCNFKLVCDACFEPLPDRIGCYVVRHVAHQCAEEIFAVQQKGSPLWVKVRERKNHRMFPGDYMKCRYFCDPYQPMTCPVGIDNCSFAHNLPEQILWTLEKDGDFNIQEFMIQNKTVSQVSQKHFVTEYVKQQEKKSSIPYSD